MEHYKSIKTHSNDKTNTHTNLYILHVKAESTTYFLLPNAGVRLDPFTV